MAEWLNELKHVESAQSTLLVLLCKSDLVTN